MDVEHFLSAALMIYEELNDDGVLRELDGLSSALRHAVANPGDPNAANSFKTSYGAFVQHLLDVNSNFAYPST